MLFSEPGGMARVFVSVFVVAVIAEDPSPWIAIVGVPSPHCSTLGDPNSLKSSGGSCFTSLYDKWVQMSGARAVGIPHDAFDTNQTALDEILRSVNGVLFTGGSVNLQDLESPYHRTGRYIFARVKGFNDAGVHYPLHGTCMGFQFLAILAANDNSSVLVMSQFDSEGLSLPLAWTDAAAKSPMVRAMPRDVYNTFGTENSTTNLHHDGVTPTTFFTNPLLPGFFNILSTNKDRVGKKFLSTIEAKDYPIRAVQWHPERNIFDWHAGRDFNHGTTAVAANAWTSNFFVGEARRNTPTNRNEKLLSQFSTYAMNRELAGSALDGYEYLHFGGFDTTSVVV